MREIALTGSVWHEDVPAFEERAARVALDALSPRTGRWTGKIGYGLEWNETREVSDAAEFILDDPEDRYLISSLHAEVGYDGTDHPLDATEGSRLRVTSELSPTWIGSEFDFLSFEAEARHYLSLGPGVLAGRIQGAVVLPFGVTSSDEIPLPRRLFAGGGGSVRGFEYQKLGPLDASDEPVGGTTRVLASLEYRFPIVAPVGGVVFLDGGHVNLDPLHVEPSEFRYSAGVGVRIATPIGPLRADFGYVLNPSHDSEDDRGRLHFSIGQAF